MTAILAYIPVVHTGVITFLDTYKNIPVYLLDNDLGKLENVYLERDIRALSAHLVRLELVAHGYTNIEVVAPSELADVFKECKEIIIPDDEIVDFFVQKYIPDVSTKKVNIFLRWTKQISIIEFQVPPDRVITKETFAKNVMHNLAKVAESSPDWWRQIAAAIVKDGKVVIEAMNAHYPTVHSLAINGDPRSNFDAGQGQGIYTSIHAEACALARAARHGVSVEGADVYVTTFPCPTCARSLVEAGVSRVFYSKGYSVLDAEEILRNAGVEIALVSE